MNLCFPNLKVKYNKTDYIAYFPNSSEIHFVGMDDGAKAEKLLGLEFSTLYYNEASQLDFSSVQLVNSRLAEKNALKKRIWFDFNPSNRSHWSYYLFIKKLNPQDDIPLSDPENYKTLKMNPSQNLENIDKEYLDMLDKMPKLERDRFLLGEFADESQGSVYYSFRSDDHVKETKVIPGTMWLGLDFNYNPFSAVVGQYYDGVFHVHDEVYLNNADTYKMADELKKRGYSGVRICPDSTGGSRRTSGRTDFEILREAGFTIESTHNPLVFDRTNNLNRLFQQNKIIINPKCKKLINDLHKVTWKDGKLDSGPDKMLTHLSDSLCYWTWKLDPFSKVIGKITQQLIR
jgi:phage terminase large subunit